MYQLALPVAQQKANIQHVPLVDVTAAFEYYLQHYNKGRPFILVGHSQGSAVLKFLLSDYMKSHPDVYKRMIAAYVVGQSITPQYLAQNPHLKFGTGPDDTGVILSWNTEAPVVDGTNPVIVTGRHRHQPDHVDDRRGDGDRRAATSAPSSWTRTPGCRYSTRTGRSSA